MAWYWLCSTEPLHQPNPPRYTTLLMHVHPYRYVCGWHNAVSSFCYDKFLDVIKKSLLSREEWCGSFWWVMRCVRFKKNTIPIQPNPFCSQSSNLHPTWSLTILATVNNCNQTLERVQTNHVFRQTLGFLVVGGLSSAILLYCSWVPVLFGAGGRYPNYWRKKHSMLFQ